MTTEYNETMPAAVATAVETETDHRYSGYTATYSPEDNKLRLSAVSRLDAETYARVKAAGFIWAPKQGIFVAPMWTPEREDLLLELAGEIGDEDTSLVERAEQRAERFEGYSDNRLADAHAARAAVDRIADGIPLGQPILIGHHSERHARRDAEKIENGMRRAVRMWDTAQYWERRAAGAIRAAKYKERPDVRARRIKGIESEIRKLERTRAEQEKLLKLWTDAGENISHETARGIANYFDHSHACYPLSEYPRSLPVSQYEGPMSIWSALGDTPELGIITPAQARERRIRSLTRALTAPRRWFDHYNNRLAYERAMLAEGGGLAADAYDIQVGGRVLRRGEWYVVTKLNKRAGALNSVTVIGHWTTTIPVEEIKGYEPPAEGFAEKVKAATKPLPLVNFRSEGCIEMTTAEWKQKSKWGDALAVRGFDADGAYHWCREEGAKPLVYRQRSRYYLGDHITGSKVVPVFLTDAKEVKPPTAPRSKVLNREDVVPERDIVEALTAPIARKPEPDPDAQQFEALRQSAKTGVQVVAAPQLFPTPPELARRVVEVSEIEPGQCVLEPSAGTGNLVRAVLDSVDTEVLAYEINMNLVTKLVQTFPSYKLQARCKDFLEVTDYMGCYPRIVMNPPFQNGADIRHIEHAMKFLAPGGRLVAICANGPRQRERLMPLASRWEDLPAGSFADQGTNVNTALVVIDVPVAEVSRG